VSATWEGGTEQGERQLTCQRGGSTAPAADGGWLMLGTRTQSIYKYSFPEGKI